MEILTILEIGVVLIFVASLVGIIVDRLRMPYTVGLVLVGLALALVNPFFLELRETFSPEAIGGILVPQLILGILVPPLIFEAAFHIQFDDLRRYLPIILAFAIPGVVLTMFMVGGVIAWGTQLALPVALVFGALIAATDPVAVVALFRTLGVPKRLQVLLEGESLFNDGTAIVIYSLMLVVVETGEFSLLGSVGDFVRVVGGGLLVGFMLSSLVSLIISRIDDSLIEVTLTIVAVYGAYLVAETFHFSGVLAVVAAGLVAGNIDPRGMSPTTRIALFNFWEYAAFLANSIVFLLIGLVIDLSAVVGNWQAILLAIGAVLIARAVVIYAFSWRSREIASRWRHVIYWGGLRGAISLALVLSLPGELLGEQLGLLQGMAFGVVLFTILVQGSTMRPLAREMKLTERSESEKEYELRQARAVAAQSAYERIERLRREGLISDHAWDILETPMKRQIEARAQSVREVLHADRSVEVAELNSAYREALRAQRSTYNTLLTSGVIDEETFSRLVSEVDTALSRDEISYADALLFRPEDRPPITRMITAVVDQENAGDAVNLLSIMGVPATQLESTGSSIGSSLVTLLIGVEAGQEEEVLHALQSCCRKQSEARPGLLEQVLTASADGEELEQEGLRVYVFDVERYEEI